MLDEIGLPNELFDADIATQAINSLNEGVTISDMSIPNQPLIFINQAFENMTGYKISEIIGKNCRFLQGNLRNQPELAIIRNAILNQGRCRTVLKNFKKDGTLFLMPENKEFKPIEVKESSEVYIWGVVISVIHLV